MNPRRFGSGISLKRVNPDYRGSLSKVLVKCLNFVHSVLEWCMHHSNASQ
jgi:hypothetical protein